MKCEDWNREAQILLTVDRRHRVQHTTRLQDDFFGSPVRPQPALRVRNRAISLFAFAEDIEKRRFVVLLPTTRDGTRERV